MLDCAYPTRSEPYDPYLPRGGSSAPPPAQGGSSKTAAIQAQIDDTVGIMRENITKVAERGERLDSLQDKTGESFPPSSSAVRRRAGRVARCCGRGRRRSDQRCLSPSPLSHRQPRRVRTGLPQGSQPRPQGEFPELVTSNRLLTPYSSSEYVVSDSRISVTVMPSFTTCPA